jgi:preprotein translocase subunit SecE
MTNFSPVCLQHGAVRLTVNSPIWPGFDAKPFVIWNFNWQLPMAKVSPAQFVRQVRQEINRISWANRRETGTATLTVFIMTAIAALFFLLVDWVLSNGVQFVLGLGS